MTHRSLSRISLAVLVLAGLSATLIAPFETDARKSKCRKGTACTSGKSNPGQQPSANPETHPRKKMPRNNASLSNSSGSSSRSDSGTTITDTGVISGI